MLYEINIGGRPYPVSEFKMPWDIAKFVMAGNRVGRKESMNDAWWNLIEACWKQDANERLSFREICYILGNEIAAMNPAFPKPQEPKEKQKEIKVEENIGEEEGVAEESKGNEDMTKTGLSTTGTNTTTGVYTNNTKTGDSHYLVEGTNDSFDPQPNESSSNE